MTTNTSRTPRLIAHFDAARSAQRSKSNSARTYTDAQLLSQLITSAKRLGNSPTINQFDADPLTSVHSHTLIARFGGWNAAKRRAGVSVHRLATDAELLAGLEKLAGRLGHVPSSAEIEAARPETFSRRTYTARFGSMSAALKAAGLRVATNIDEQLDMAIEAAVGVTTRTGQMPTMGEWAHLRSRGEALPSQWQVYRLCQNGQLPPWQVFTALVDEAMDARS